MGSVRFGSVGFGSVRLGWVFVGLGWFGLGSAGLGSVELSWVRLYFEAEGGGRTYGYACVRTVDTIAEQEKMAATVITIIIQTRINSNKQQQYTIVQ